MRKENKKSPPRPALTGSELVELACRRGGVAAPRGRGGSIQKILDKKYRLNADIFFMQFSYIKMCFSGYILLVNITIRWE